MEDSLIDPRYRLIKCEHCGAPIHYDAARDGFSCPSCSSFYPFAGSDALELGKFSLAHVPLDLQDGVYVPHNLDAELDMAFGQWELNRNWTYTIDQKYLSHRKVQDFRTRQMISHTCPMCGGDVQAFESQNVWDCPYCSNQFVRAEVLAGSDYETFDVVDLGDEMMPHFAIPFKITREQAKRIILDFAAQRPRAFEGQQLEERLDNLWSVFVPHQLTDTTLVAHISTEEGSMTFVQDRVNWLSPTADDHHYYLVSDVGPWDVSEIQPFCASLAEGDVVFDHSHGTECGLARFIQANVLRPELLEASKGILPGQQRRVDWIRREVRACKTVMLPVYFLDRGKDCPKAYFMVNGQTGAVAVLGRGEMQGHKTLFAPGGLAADDMRETSLNTPLMPVRQQEDGTYRVMPPEDAVIRTTASERRAIQKETSKKKKGFFAKLFS